MASNKDTAKRAVNDLEVVEEYLQSAAGRFNSIGDNDRGNKYEKQAKEVRKDVDIVKKLTNPKQR